MYRKKRNNTDQLPIKYFLTVLIFVMLLSACGKPVMNIRLISSVNTNPDENGKGLPVVVRFYQLANVEVFNETGSSEMWKDDIAILNGDLLYRQESTVRPSSHLGMTIRKKENAVYFGVAVFFRDMDNGSWKKVYKLKNSRKENVSISISEKKVYFTEKK